MIRAVWFVSILGTLTLLVVLPVAAQTAQTPVFEQQIISRECSNTTVAVGVDQSSATLCAPYLSNEPAVDGRDGEKYGSVVDSTSAQGDSDNDSIESTAAPKDIQVPDNSDRSEVFNTTPLVLAVAIGVCVASVVAYLATPMLRKHTSSGK